jgi:hypothetical protein
MPNMSGEVLAVKERVRQFQSDAVFALLRLTLIALAGIIVKTRQYNNGNLDNGYVDGDENLIAFPLPSHGLDTSFLPVDIKSNSSSSSRHASIVQLEVRAVVFADTADVDMLWLETIKTLCDLYLHTDTNFVKKVMFTLHVSTFPTKYCTSNIYWFTCMSCIMIGGITSRPSG